MRQDAHRGSGPGERNRTVERPESPVDRLEIARHGQRRRRRRPSWLGHRFRHDADLLREGDEARVVLVGAQEGIARQTQSRSTTRAGFPEK